MTVDGKPFPPSPPSSPKVVVVKAIYGVPGDAQRTRNVTAKVQKLIDADMTSFTVAEMAQGDDPAYQVVKTLEIDYTVNGKPSHVRGKDPEVIQLPIGLGWQDLCGAVGRSTACRAMPCEAATSRPPCRVSWTRG